jgi:ribosome-binding protein aMBF1 (putative translation factor)
MNNLRDKLLQIEHADSSNWKEKAKYRRENRDWLNISAAIAVKVLDALKAKKISQKDLAERMHISPQQVNKILKGQENLTIESISNLENSLGIKIIEGIKKHRQSAA